MKMKGRPSINLERSELWLLVQARDLQGALHFPLALFPLFFP